MPRPRKATEFSESTVAVSLDEAQLAIKAQDLARICGEVDKLRADAADHASTERKKVRALEKQRRVLAECVRTGEEKVPAQLGFKEAGPLTVVGEKGSPSAKSRGKSADA